MVVPWRSRTKTFRNLADIQLFSQFLYLFQIAHQEFWKVFLCLRQIWVRSTFFSSSTNKLPDLELQSAHLHFRSIMCQSAWRRHREVSLISSATRCCHLQSTPWCCKEENKPKFCLLIYGECCTNESFTLLWSITVTNTISSKTPSGWVKVKATIFLI